MIAVSFEKTSKAGKIEIIRGVRLTPQHKADKEMIRDILRRGVEVDGIDENGALYLRLCK
jgi:hypothetical protein